MSSSILSFLGWTFLPEFVTGNLQSFYYALTIRAGDPRPQPGSPLYATHRRRIYIFVIVSYLIYTLVEADWDIRRVGDFYSDLGVPHDVDNKILQTRFRRLTLQYHPDKISSDASSEQRMLAEQFYVRLTLARDTLLDPTKRFAYDRFGPDAVITWKGCCSTVKDYVYIGLRRLVPFYIMSVIGLVVSGWMGFLGGGGQYWRFLALGVLFTLELHSITRPTFPLITLIPTVANSVTARAPLSLLGPYLAVPRQPYLPYQLMQFAHRATVTFFIALARLGPILKFQISGVTPQMDASSAGEEAQFQRLNNAIAALGAEAGRLLALEIVPFQQRQRQSLRQAPGSDDSAEARLVDSGTQTATVSPGLRGAMKEWLIGNTVRNDPEVRRAVATVVSRRATEGEPDLAGASSAMAA